MRKLLKIADIFIDFTYNYDEYFKDTLDKYEVEDESKDYHKIIIKVEKDIEIPIKSNYNIKKEWMFYKIHGESIRTYKGFFSKFNRYIGGFFKWKILGFLGIKRKERQL